MSDAETDALQVTRDDTPEQTEEQYQEAHEEQFEEQPLKYHKQEDRTQETEESHNGDLYPQESNEDTSRNGIDPDDEYDKSITEDFIYEIRETAEFTETRALLIANLTAPFDNKDFQDILNEYASKTESTIERAWLNARRTHCIVIVSDIAGAASIQKNLNGKWFPFTESNEPPAPEFDEEGNEIKRHQLFIDFIPVKATQHWIDQENKGPKDAIWKFSYVKLPSKQQQGSEFLVATHKMLNYPNKTFGYKSSGQARGIRGRSRARGSYRGRGGRSSYYSGPPSNYQPRYAPYGPPAGDYNSPYYTQDPYGGYNDYQPPAPYQQRYGGIPQYPPRGSYYPREGGYQRNTRGGYRGGRGSYNGGYGGGANRYDSYPDTAPPSSEGGVPLTDNEYRRERSPMRPMHNERAYGSRSPTRSPPRQTRSPEWSD